VVVHAVPGSICRRYVAVVVAGSGTLALVDKHAIQLISIVVDRVLGRDTAVVAYIWLYVKNRREDDVLIHLSTLHLIPVHNHNVFEHDENMHRYFSGINKYTIYQ